MPAPTTTTVTGSPRGLGYHARIGTTYLRLAAAPDRAGVVQSAPLESDRVNLNENPEDFGNEFGALFSRSDFRGGEGLEFAHRRNSGDVSDRYYDSRNIDVTRDGQLKLLHTTALVGATANTGLYATQVGGSVYWTDGTTLQTTANPAAATPTVTAESPHAGEVASTVADVVALGSTLYAAVGDGIHRKTSGGAWAHWLTLAGVDRIWAVKGRLMVAADAVLYEVTTAATPTSTALVTLAAGETWNDAADGSTHVLAAASDGHVYAFTDDGTAFALASQTYLEGEIPTAVASVFGVAFYATGQALASGAYVGRLYRASLRSDGTFEGIQQLRRWGDPDTETLDRRPMWLQGGRDSVFCAVRESATEVDLWRYDLAFGAMHRSYIVGAGGVCRDFLLVDGIPWAWVDGSGPWRRTSLYATSGYLIGPLVDFFRAEEKAWAGILLAHETMTGSNGRIEASYTTSRDAIDDPDGAWTLFTAVASGDSGTEKNLANVEARYLAVKIVLTSSAAADATPTFSAYSVRAYPGPGDTIIRLPVNVSDQYERRGRPRRTIPGLGADVIAALRGLEGTSRQLELIQYAETYQGTVLEVDRPMPTLTARGTPALVAMVTFRGRLVSESGNTRGDVLFATTNATAGGFASYPLFGKVGA